MFKVLSAYSNLNELMKDQEQKMFQKFLQDENESDSSSSSSSGHSTSPSIRDRKQFRQNQNSHMRNELIESFCELSFEDSTKYVQGMNFIVGILSYHFSPELAFSVFIKLMKDYDLESNYAPGLVGFKQKSDVLNGYMNKYLPDLSKFLVIFIKF